jgi:hypothetical protein
MGRAVGRAASVALGLLPEWSGKIDTGQDGSSARMVEIREGSDGNAMQAAMTVS